MIQYARVVLGDCRFSLVQSVRSIPSRPKVTVILVQDSFQNISFFKGKEVLILPRFKVNGPRSRQAAKTKFSQPYFRIFQSFQNKEGTAHVIYFLGTLFFHVRSTTEEGSAFTHAPAY